MKRLTREYKMDKLMDKLMDTSEWMLAGLGISIVLYLSAIFVAALMS